MAEHENSIGKSDDWYTPREYFPKLDLTFDVDPCSPGPGHWVPARKIYTKADDGLTKPWEGLVFMNPPFGGRHGHLAWLERFLDHGNGIAVVRAYTSSDWWFSLVYPRAEAILYPEGKTKFIPGPDALVQLELAWRKRKRDDEDDEFKFRNAPGHGIALIGMGDVACNALAKSGLGVVWDRRQRAA